MTSKKTSNQTKTPTGVPSDAQIKGVVQKSLDILRRISEDEEIALFSSLVGEKLPQIDILKNLGKIQSLWTGLGLPNRTIQAHPWGQKPQTWEGVEIPEKWLNKLRVQRSERKGFSTFILAICDFGQENKAKRQTLNSLMKWALASGFSANEYNGRVTGVGLAAYTGQLDLLKTMQAGGADLLLELKSEHLQDQSLVGSTLLHRMAQRADDHRGKIEVAKFLMEVYENPMPVDNSGNTPLTHATGEMYSQLHAIAARREKEQLQASLDLAQGVDVGRVRL